MNEEVRLFKSSLESYASKCHKAKAVCTFVFNTSAAKELGSEGKAVWGFHSANAFIRNFYDCFGSALVSEEETDVQDAIFEKVQKTFICYYYPKLNESKHLKVCIYYVPPTQIAIWGYAFSNILLRFLHKPFKSSWV